uniref:Uncharacterized protein n=1 Tax=Noctiluca scintillans TaxID=2966 RepID=A0A7S1FGS2_NOCSC|mmetsp:Transcript_60109/g.159910  ORF Transcript_60109/g.159910 Transcript_60109/m.159910 type:complete len:686 (+) Transcript_60109:43-2100(+)
MKFVNMKPTLAAVAAFVSLPHVHVMGVQLKVRDSESANPIRHVVTMLQKLAADVEAEGRSEQGNYKKFQCYCKTTGAELETSIAGSDVKVPDLSRKIELAISDASSLAAEIKQAREDLAAARDTLAGALALRDKEKVENGKQLEELTGFVQALEQARDAVSKGLTGNFLQAKVGTTLRQAVSNDGSVSDYDRQLVMSFLEGGKMAAEFSPGTSEIIGILKQMLDDFRGQLEELKTQEASQGSTFENMAKAKNQEIDVLLASLEIKTKQEGDLRVSVVNMKNELTETEQALIESKKLAETVAADCSKKESEWAQRQKLRNEELVAIHETIKILNDDDALDTFRKALPSPSLLQTTPRLAARLGHLVHALDRLDEPTFKFLSLLVMGKKFDFSKVIHMIDNMLDLLGKEMRSDELERDQCHEQITYQEDEHMKLKKTVEDNRALMGSLADQIDSMTAAVAALRSDIDQLDATVKDATVLRKSQAAENAESMSNNRAAAELLAFARAKLAEFFSHVSPHTEKHSELSTSSDLTRALISLVQVDVPTKPETWTGDYQAHGGYHQVDTLMLRLISDLQLDLAEVKGEEESLQKAYELMMTSAGKTRAAKAQEIQATENAIADNTVEKVQAETDAIDQGKQLHATETFLSELHMTCDWLLQNFDLRRDAFRDEIAALQQAKEVLTISDMSA